MYDNKYTNVFEQIMDGVAQYGRHARIKIFANKTGTVYDDYGRIVFRFASLTDLLNKLVEYKHEA
jgi:hypothetical protein